MNSFFGSQLPPEELQRQQQQQNQQRAQAQAQQQRQQNAPGQLSMAGGMPTSQAFQPSADPMSAVSDTSMFDGESLDDIIRNNSQEIHRRRSITQPAYPGTFARGDGDRNMDMMDFATPTPGDYRNFDFGSMDAAATSPTSVTFPGMGGPMGGQNPAFARGAPAGSRPQDYSGMQNMTMGDMVDFSTLSMNTMSAPGAQMGIFTNPSMEPMSPTFTVDPAMDNMGQMEGGDSMMNMDPSFATSGPVSTQLQQPQQQSAGLSPFAHGVPTLSRHSSSMSGTSYHSPASGAQSVSPNLSRQASTAPSAGLNAQVSSIKTTTVGPEPKETKNIYSKSGFDMIRALYYVATRPNPEVQLGAVDMSCAFVVCDVTQNDCPIIYVSDNFQNLTGYSRYEIMGRNCRFLQSPDGKVEAGTRREFVANDAVYNLKRKVAEGKEIQQSLINYRKGGKPFLNLLTMIPIPWDNKDEIRFFIGFQIDLVECPDAVSGQDTTSMLINYKNSEIPQYIWNPPKLGGLEMENGQTLGVDDISTLLQQYNPKGALSDWHKQSWDKMLLENTDDVVHVLSLKGLFQYLSPSCKRVLEYDSLELVGHPLSAVCHPSDIVPVTRELKEAVVGTTVNLVFRIRRKTRGYTWFESRGSLFTEQGKGRKCIVLVGRKRPVFALRRRDLEANGGIGDSEFWSKLSTSGMILHSSSNVRSLLDLQPDNLVGTSIQELMRKDSRAEFGRSVEKARRGRIVSCRHEVQNRRGQVLQALTILYPGDASEGEKPTFLLAQTKLLKASPRAGANAPSNKSVSSVGEAAARGQPGSLTPQGGRIAEGPGGLVSAPSSVAVALGSQDAALAADDNIFDELKTTRCTSWQFELRQMEKENRSRAEELGQLLSNRKKRKRRKGTGGQVRDCANCHTRNTPEWRRGPSGQRDLCNSCGLRWAKQMGRVSPRNSARGDSNQSRKSNGSNHSSPLHNSILPDPEAPTPAGGADGDSKSGGTNSNSPPTPKGENGASGSASGSGGAAGGPKVADLMPPPSQPSGMEMTSIPEEGGA